MPNRIIREGYLTSLAVNELSPQAEIFYFRLMLKADDFGRYTAHTSLLKAALYPLKLESIREADISRWIAECVKAGLIALYEAEDKSCLVIRRFRQRTRAKASQWPKPPDGLMTDACLSRAHGGGYGDEGGGDARAGAAGAEPAIPTVQDVIAFGSLGSAIPEDFCRHYHATCTNKHRWFSHGKLILWQNEIKDWWEKDKGGWAARKGSHGTRQQGHRKHDRNDNANAGSAGLYKANVQA